MHLDAMNGRMTRAQILSLPEPALFTPEAPQTEHTPIMDSLTAVLAAQDQRFRLGVCADCGGTEVFSKTRPLARCLRCRALRVLTRPAPIETRYRCAACKTMFRSVMKYLKCPKCRAAKPVQDISPTKIVRQS